jgi:hypothetical protein
MIPKEKAKELFFKMSFETHSYNAKHCALIAVDEIMEFMKMDDEYTETSYNANSKWVNYWLEVKQEINKL